MDIDVSNAYRKAAEACGMLGRDVLVAKTYAFIKAISIRRAEERFDEFCKIYITRSVNKDTLYNRDAVLPKKAIEFFEVLGKHYLFSRYDRKDINAEAIVKFIKDIPKPSLKNAVADVSDKPTSPHKNKGSQKIDKADNAESQAAEDAPEMQEPAEPEASFEELMEELHSMIGLEGVKNEVDQIINLLRIQKKEEELGEKKHPISLHLVFYGNPGTGKTTIARLLAKIYKSLGVLSKGQLIEKDRSGLVAEYVGQTAPKTEEAIREAMGGILFIDEAYTLTHGKDNFGQEAVEKLLKEMEDHRDDFVVIVAGYKDLMKEFIDSNPGLKSRFNQYINFEDYTPEQLRDIFNLQCSKRNWSMDEASEAYVLSYFKDLYENRDANYANGRDVRNYFEKVVRARANRIAPLLDCTPDEELKELLWTIDLSDLKAAKEMKSTNW